MQHIGVDIQKILFVVCFGEKVTVFTSSEFQFGLSQKVCILNRILCTCKMINSCILPQYIFKYKVVYVILCDCFLSMKCND